MGCYIWYNEEGPGWAAASPSPLLAVPNLTAHPLTASVPITVLLYDGPLLRSFIAAIEGLRGSSLTDSMLDLGLKPIKFFDNAASNTVVGKMIVCVCVYSTLHSGSDR